MSLRSYVRRIAAALRRRTIHAAKAAGRPLVHRFYLRMDARTAELRSELDGVRSYLPPILNSIQTQNALSRRATRDEQAVLARLDEVTGRVEAARTAALEQLLLVRNDLFSEIRRRPGAELGALEDDAKVVNPEKLQAMAGSLRLNLGCGEAPLPDFVNVDRRSLDHVDVVGDVRRLPFAPGEVDQIYSADLLGDFTLDELEGWVLPYWCTLLRPGALFIAVVPDGEGTMTEYLSGQLSYEGLRSAFGAHTGDEGSRSSLFTAASLVALLERAGLVEVTARRTAHRRGRGVEVEVIGTRPSGAAG